MLILETKMDFYFQMAQSFGIVNGGGIILHIPSHLLQTN